MPEIGIEELYVVDTGQEIITPETRLIPYAYNNWLSLLQEKDIPVLIFSAGLTDVIEEVSF